MKICAISDLHGYLDFTVPACDLLLIAGDLCPDYAPNSTWGSDMQAKWLNTRFMDWLVKQPASIALATFGNHDFIGKEVVAEDVRHYFLVDEAVEIQGLKIWLSPWSNTFMRWAWMEDPNQLADRYARIPASTDIIVSHQPPHGICDRIPDNYLIGSRKEEDPHVGSHQLYHTIEHVRPMAVICGHIHNGYGQDTIVCDDGYKVPVYNVSIVDEAYRRVHEPTLIEF